MWPQRNTFFTCRASAWMVSITTFAFANNVPALLQIRMQQQSGHLVRGAVCRNEDIRHWVLPNVLCNRTTTQQVGKLSPISKQVSRLFVLEGADDLWDRAARQCLCLKE
jgi:hypothetical protein